MFRLHSDLQTEAFLFYFKKTVFKKHVFHRTQKNYRTFYTEPELVQLKLMLKPNIEQSGYFNEIQRCSTYVYWWEKVQN